MTAGTLRTDYEHAVLPTKDTAAASGNCIYVQLWALNSHTSSNGFEDVLEVATISRNISGGSTHIEPDDWAAVGCIKRGL